jgi:hypothetical protein
MKKRQYTIITFKSLEGDFCYFIIFSGLGFVSASVFLRLSGAVKQKAGITPALKMNDPEGLKTLIILTN